MTRFLFVYGTKGGVGKSTIAVNLAYALRANGPSVGLVDIDLSGPNIPDLISGLEGRPPTMEGFRVVPGQYGGVEVVSLGFFVEPHEASLLTGKYLEGALEQVLFTNRWTQDFVVIDLPPGFHELHRIVFTRLHGAVVLVTTPHLLSYNDLARGQRFLEQLGAPVLGLVENMCSIRCSHCAGETPLFERGATDSANIGPLLAQVPFVFEPVPVDGRRIPLVLVDDERVAGFRSSILDLAATVQRSA